MASAHSACSACWGWEAIKQHGPSCRSCARPWCGQGGIISVDRSRSMKPMWAALSTAFGVVARRLKFIVVIAIEVLSPKGFGRVRMQRVDDVSGASLVPFVCSAVESGSEVHTDGWKGYNGLSEQGYRHRLTKTSNSGDPAHVSMPGVHRVAALLKRWLLGYPPGIGYSGASGCLSQRIRLSIQPPPLPPSRFALPPTTAKCCRHPANSVQAIALSRPDAKPQPVVVTVLRQLPPFRRIERGQESS
jgi:hypothetical protein